VVWKSKDFLNWSFDGILIPDVKWGTLRYWAPGRVIKKDNKYYLFATVVNFHTAHGYMAMSDKPEGPFHFEGGPPGPSVFARDDLPGGDQTVVKPVLPDIDGDPFVDDDGSACIVWRKRKAAKLSPDLLSIQGPIIDIPTKRPGYSEGPFLFKRKGISIMSIRFRAGKTTRTPI